MKKFLLFMLCISLPTTAFGKYWCGADTCSAEDGLYGCGSTCFPCPENSICPNPQYGNTASPQAWQIYCNAGYFAIGNSQDGTLRCIKCPDEFDCPEKTTIQDLPCPVGWGVLHIGEYNFNIYADVCPAPAIKLGNENGTCCIPLDEGPAQGVNVDINGLIYHLVNW